MGTIMFEDAGVEVPPPVPPGAIAGRICGFALVEASLKIDTHLVYLTKEQHIIARSLCRTDETAADVRLFNVLRLYLIGARRRVARGIPRSFHGIFDNLSKHQEVAKKQPLCIPRSRIHKLIIWSTK